MTHISFAAALALAVSLAAPALAEITVVDAFVRSASPMAMSAAAYMTLNNKSDADDRLIGVKTDIAAKAEVHVHRDLGNGVMQMGPVEGGLLVPANGSHGLSPGGDHVMLMGLNGPLTDGALVTVTLQFETAGEISIQVPVDQSFKPQTSQGGGS